MLFLDATFQKQICATDISSQLANALNLAFIVTAHAGIASYPCGIKQLCL